MNSAVTVSTTFCDGKADAAGRTGDHRRLAFQYDLKVDLRSASQVIMDHRAQTKSQVCKNVLSRNDLQHRQFCDRR